MQRLRPLIALSSFLIAASAFGAADAAAPTASGTILYTFARSTGAQGSWLEVTDLSGANTRVLTPIPSSRTQRYDTDATLSPDGTEVAFIRERGRGGNALYVVNADGTDLHPVVGPEQVGRGIDHVVWSPQGDELAFQREAANDQPGGNYGCNTSRSQLGIYLVSPDGSGLTQLPVLVGHAAPSLRNPLNLSLREWSYDGNQLLYTIDAWTDGECVNPGAHFDSATLNVIGRNGGAASRIFKTDYPIDEVAFSPDGYRIARSVRSVSGSCSLILRTISSATVRTLATHSVDCEDGGLSFGWVPSGQKIVFSNGLHIGVINVNSGAERTVLRRTNLPQDCRIRGNAGVCQEGIADFSSDGSVAAVVDYSTDPFAPIEKILLVGIDDGVVARLPLMAAGPRTGRPASDIDDVEIHLN
jgi:Tol biopolymer transport system component